MSPTREGYLLRRRAKVEDSAPAVLDVYRGSVRLLGFEVAMRLSAHRSLSTLVKFYREVDQEALASAVGALDRLQGTKSKDDGAAGGGGTTAAVNMDARQD